jgi:hypothetical protein
MIRKGDLFLLKNSLIYDINFEVRQKKSKWKITIIVLYVLCLFLPSFLSAAELLPFRDLSADELSQLQSGEPLFRVLDSYKDICFETEDWESGQIKDLLKEVNPVFLAEIIMVIPVDPNQDNLDFIRNSLLDVTSFDKIPYYSVDDERWYKLFYNSKILSKLNNSSEKIQIEAEHRMKPFTAHETLYKYSLIKNILFFQSRNTTPIYYKGIRAVKEGNMISILWIRDEGKQLIVYGIGGAKAFTFFGLFGKRMDAAFTGRINAFFSWFYDTVISKLII